MRLLGDGAGEEHPLALPAGQRLEPVPGAVGEPDRFQGTCRDGPVRAGGLPYPAERAVTAHEDGLGDGHLRVGPESVDLRDIGDPAAGLHRWAAEYRHRSAHHWGKPEQRFHQRRLSGAVRADDGYGTAAFDRSMDVLQHRDPVVGDRRPVEDHGRGRSGLSRFIRYGRIRWWIGYDPRIRRDRTDGAVRSGWPPGGRDRVLFREIHRPYD